MRVTGNFHELENSISEAEARLTENLFPDEEVTDGTN